MADEAILVPTGFRARPLASGVIGLDADEVHLWRADLSLSVRELAVLLNHMSEDEQARAQRFRFQKNRNEFISARGLLRKILASYLDIEPVQVKFSYEAYGKPELADELDAPGLRFNVSHSHGLCLYAIARGRDVGVDVEYIRPDLARERIAESLFSPADVAAIRALPLDMQAEAFFACWTRKEAHLKALGKGLLDGWRASVCPKPTTSDWIFWRLVPGPEHVGALAVKGEHLRLTCWYWPDEGAPLD